MKKSFFVTLVIGVLFLITGPAVKRVLAAPVATQTNGPESKAVNVGNKICPVSGEAINEDTKATYEYEGKIYNFCCPMCIKPFKKDLQKYINKVNEELQAGSKK